MICWKINFINTWSYILKKYAEVIKCKIFAINYLNYVKINSFTFYLMVVVTMTDSANNLLLRGLRINRLQLAFLSPWKI